MTLPSSSAWSTGDIPDLSGTRSVVTGPSVGGIGYATALELARHGSEVILAGRNQTKLEEAAAAISAAHPGARTSTVLLDLSSLTSVREAAGHLCDGGPLDLLVNNAGVMATPARHTVDGLELQIGTNHYGPFLLTGLVLPRIIEASGRIVTVSSLAHTLTREAPLADPRSSTGRYRRWPTYSRTKLANLLFTYELDRRLRAGGVPVRALAAHPGFAHTHLVTNGATFGPLSRALNGAYGLISPDAAGGALPSLMAATADLPSGTYVGPGRFRQTQGAPRVVRSTALSHDPEIAAQLWRLSEAVTEFTWL
jgi:NAD(P)-dependent dehydrogenase (short-subunit alcohol dehydrogenase family)